MTRYVRGGGWRWCFFFVDVAHLGIVRRLSVRPTCGLVDAVGCTLTAFLLLVSDFHTMQQCAAVWCGVTRLPLSMPSGDLVGSRFGEGQSAVAV